MGNSLFTAGSQSVGVSNVLAFMKITGSYEHARRTVVMNEVIREHALHSGITIPDEALQVYSDLRRIELGFHSSVDFVKYLEIAGVSLETWEKTLENELLRVAARQKFGSNIFLVDAWKLIRGIPEIREHITEALIAKGKEKGLNISQEDLQTASDAARRVTGMHNAEEFLSILNALKMNENDWERYLHSNISLSGLDPDEQYELFDREIKAALDKYPVLNGLINDIIFGQVIHARAKKLKITISDDEVNSYIESFRRAFKLHSVNAFNIWLSATGMHIDEFVYVIQTELLKRKMAEKGVKGFDEKSIEDSVKASAYFVNAFNTVKNFAALTETAKSKNLIVTEDDVNIESEYLRRAKRLHKAEDFHRFLAANNLNGEDWEWYCECSGLIRKLYEHETSDDKLINYIKVNQEVKNQLKYSLFGEIARSARNTLVN